MQPKVSIVLVFYNDEKYLSQTLDSCLKQTFQDFEIILLDNGSIDNSRKIVDNYKEQDSRIKIIENEKNYHLCGENFAKLVNHASGSYVKLFCADDIMHPECIETQVTFLDNNPNYIACFSHMKTIDEDSNLKKKTFKSQIKSDRFSYLNHIFYHGNAFLFPTAIVRKEHLIPSEFDNRLRHFFDVTLWIKLLKKGEVKVIDEDLIKYRLRNDQGNVSNISNDQIRERLYLFEMNHIYNDFFNLDNVFEYQEIFPESQNLLKKITKEDTDLLSFITCLMLYNRENFSPFHFSVYRNIALNKIYSLIENKELMQKIKNKLGYTNLDLYLLAEHYNEGSTYSFASRARNKIAKLFYKFYSREKYKELALKNKINF